MLSHGAVASRHLGKGFVESILGGDRHALALAPRLTAVLDVLEILTLRPLELHAEQIGAAIEAGAGAADLQQAAAICSSFSFLNRFVDAFGADIPAESVDRVAVVLDNGFALLVAPNRGKPWSQLAETLTRAKHEVLESI